MYLSHVLKHEIDEYIPSKSSFILGHIYFYPHHLNEKDEVIGREH